MNKLKKLLEKINNEFKSNEVYVVGGCIRDIIMNRSYTDVDLIIKNLSVQKLKDTIHSLNLPVVVLDDINKIYRTVIKSEGFTVDISGYTSFNEDINRRDFTINTLCISLEKFIEYLTTRDKKVVLKNIVDLLGGLKDIKKKILRVTNDTTLKDDPLRILRIARFMCDGFVPDKKLNMLVEQNINLISNVAKERVVTELKKIFSYSRSYNILLWLDKNEILDKLFPEIKIIKVQGRNTKFRNFYYHKEGLWQHTKLTYQKIEFILDNLTKIFKSQSDVVKNYFEKNPNGTFCLKLAGLFHDIAKPLVIKKINGKIRFFYHESKSEEITKKILLRIKLSNNEIETVSKLIKNHMRLGNLCHTETLTERAYLRLFNELGDTLIPLTILSLADRYSYDSIPERAKELKLKELPKFRKFTRNVLEKYVNYKQKTELPRLVNGHFVMKKFNLEEGPMIGKILSAVREKQILGEIKTKFDAEKFIEKILLTLKE